MSLQPGEEFKIVATPSQELLRKLAYLAAVGSESVLTVDGLHGGGAASERKAATADGVADIVQFLDQQRARQRQIDDLMNRLDDLDRASVQALQDAQDHLDEIMRTANRTIDGRLVFEGEDGKIFDEDGSEVGAEEIDWETWNPKGPGLDDFRDALQDRSDAFAIQEKVDGLKDRISGDMSDEDVSDIENEIDALSDDLAEFSGASLETTDPDGVVGRTTSAAKLYGVEGVSDGPTVGSQFSNAVMPPAVTPRAAPTAKPASPFTPD